MTKKRKQTSSFRQRLGTLFSTLATMIAGAGIGGWAFPDIPIVGPIVQRVVSATQGTSRSPITAGAGHPTSDPQSIPPQYAQPGAGYGPPPGASGSVSPVAAALGRPVSARARPAAPGNTITICSFNIQVFGESKLGKPAVMDRLAQIVRFFDLVAIQEIRSRSDSIMPDFLRMINADGSRYDFVIGPRLGRSNSKEQYSFVFNTDRIEVDPRSVLTIDDPADLLHREPLLARFRARTPNPAQGFTFWLMNAHTDPDEVPQEVDALATAFTSVQQGGWGEDDVILLGDLNASETQLGRLGTLPGIRYAIAGVPTNTRGSKTYDNILFDGRTTVEFTGESGVGNVMQHFGLSVEQALEISDHLPVWAKFSAYEGGGGPPVVAQQPYARSPQ